MKLHRANRPYFGRGIAGDPLRVTLHVGTRSLHLRLARIHLVMTQKYGRNRDSGEVPNNLKTD